MGKAIAKETKTADDRTLRRSAVQSIYPLTCRVIGPDYRVDADIVNFHSFGACLKLHSHYYSVINNYQNSELELYIGRNKTEKNIRFRVSWIDGKELIGVQFQFRSASIYTRAHRVRLPHFLVIPACANDPLEPRRLLYFSVQEVSASGLLLATSLANRHLTPGMKLRNCKVSFPDGSEFEGSFVIQSSRVSGDGQKYLVGVVDTANSEEFARTIERFTLNSGLLAGAQDSPSTPFKVKPKNASRFLTFGVVEKLEEYEKVLKLRYEAYSAHKKTLSSEAWQDQGDGLDHEGMVFIASLGSELIGTFELRFSHKQKLKLFDYVEELEDRFKGKTLLEVNRLAIHPNFNGTDILLGIMQKIHYIAEASGSPDVILAATDKLVPLYLRCGAINLNCRFPHPKLPNTFLNAMLIKKSTYKSAEGMNPYAWSVVYSELNKYLATIGIVQNDPLTFRQKLVLKVTEFITSVIPQKNKRPRKQ